MAQIRKRKNSYQIIVCNGEDVNGKRIEKTMTYHPDPKLTPKQLEKTLLKISMEFEEKVKTGNLFDGDKMTFSEFYKKWYDEYGVLELEKTTLSVYNRYINLRVLPVLGNMKLSSIKAVHLNSLYNAMRKADVKNDGTNVGYSAGTIKKVHAVISSVLKQAVLWDIIETNPCDKVKKIKGVKATDDIQCFDVEQTMRFLNALDMEYDKPVKERKRKDNNGKEYSVAPYISKITIPTQFKVFFYIAIYGGLRRGELLALQWSDIDFANNTIDISKATGYSDREMYQKATKNKSSNRVINLPGSVMNLLAKYKKEYLAYQLQLGSQWAVDENGKRLNFLFVQSNGKQMHISTPRKKFHTIIEMYNSKVENDCNKLPLIPLHGLRHTCATLLISQGVDITTVAGRLGHSQTSTTLDIYSHPLQKLDVIASEKLENLLVKEA